MRSVGIFSGTFDPVHNGHVAFCLEAIKECGLDEVVIIPERQPREKNDVTDITHRLALLEQATAAYAQIRVMNLASPQFTISHTLPELRRIFKDAELSLLLGSDVVRTFSYRWPDLGALLGTMQLVIGLRAGDRPQDIELIVKELRAHYHVPIRCRIIVSPKATLTSSQIRGNKTFTEVHPAVSAYIKDRGIYG